MDAGKFNFNKIGGAKPPQNTPPAVGGPKESPSVQQDPTESVQFGSRSLLNEGTDQLSTGQKEQPVEVAQQRPSFVTSSIPSQVGDFLIAGPGSVGMSGQANRVTFDGLTALNGLSSSSLQSVGEKTVASVNPLNPKDATKPPTTSADLVVSTFEDSQWLTTSGRVISL